MADVYYKIDGNNIYYCNEQKDGYSALIHTTPPISNGKNLIIDYIDNKFILPSNSSGLCYGITNSNLNETYKWDASGVSWMEGMFGNCPNLNYISLGNWDVSNVSNMQTMFYKSPNITNSSISIGNWNTHNVSNMFLMFGRTGITNNDFMKNWDMSKVRTIETMFSGCERLTRVDMSNWDLASIKNVGGVFNNCYNLELILAPIDTDWNDGVIQSGNYVFRNCTKLSNWDGVEDITRANNTQPSGYFRYVKRNYSTYLKFADNWVSVDLLEKDSDSWKQAEVYM